MKDTAAILDSAPQVKWLFFPLHNDIKISLRMQCMMQNTVTILHSISSNIFQFWLNSNCCYDHTHQSTCL